MLGSIDTPDVSMAVKTYKQAVKDAPSEAARQILDGDRLAFFDVAERVFTAEIERREADPSEINGSVASELGGYVDRLPALREVFGGGVNYLTTPGTPPALRRLSSRTHA